MKIKVTGFLDTEDMDPMDVDETHPMGVASHFYEQIASGQRPLPTLDEVEFAAEPDDAPEAEPADRAERYAKKRKGS